MPPAKTQYDSLSKAELIRILTRRDHERPYGLVWEREYEPDNAINDDFIALDHDAKLSHGDAPYENLIIEGDNYDALRVLRMTHPGKIRCILIDPPYNTGNKDFVYNDRFVNKDHDYRHSLWLEFMYKRLVIARELLAADGAIFVNIGEDSYALLSLLMERVFPEMKVGTFVWRTRQGANDPSGARFSQDHEYVLCYARPGFTFGGVEKSEELYKNPDNDPRGPWQSDNITKPATLRDRPNAYYPVQNPETGVWYPCNPDAVWRFASEARLKPGQKTRTETMEERIRTGRILWPMDERIETFATRAALDKAIASGDAPAMLRAGLPDLDFWVGKPIGYGRPRVKRFWTDMKDATKPLSSWMPSSLDQAGAGEPKTTSIQTGTTQEGTTTLQQVMGGKVFDFPKPVSLIQGIIAQATRPDRGDIVLDFFAGSGTTGHAVLAQNAEDDGNRTFILVSSREATKDEPRKNICQDITRVRVKRVMEGYDVRGKKNTRSVAGTGGNFGYLKARRISYQSAAVSLDHGAIWTALQLMHAGVYRGFDDNESVQKVALEHEDVLYLPSLSKSALKALAKSMSGRRAATVYSHRPDAVREALDFDVASITLARVPEEILQRFGGRK
jgi:adenine-specific DNA-methyltransferase